MPQRLRKVLDFSLRFVLSGAMLALVLWRVNPVKVFTHMGEINYWWVGAGILVALCGYLLAGVRWHLFMRAHDLDVKLGDSLWAMFAGLFLGNFLPAGAGVDVVRGAWIVRQKGELAKVSASIIIDRLSGFIVLAFTALAAIWTRPAFRLPVALVGVILLVGTVLAFTDPFLRLAEKLLCQVKWLRIGERSVSFLRAFHFYGRKPSLLLVCFLLAVLLQEVFALVGYLVSLALGFNPPVWTFLLLVPTINLVTMLPVSISGFGLREGGFMFFFKPWMPEPACVALSFLYFATCLVPTLVGMVPLWFKKKPSAES